MTKTETELNTARRTTIELKIQNQVATLLLVPKASNKPPLLDLEVITDFFTALEQLQDQIRQQNCKVVLLRSSSPRFFCCGADIQVLETICEDTFGSWIIRGNHLMAQIAALPVPVIAVVNGYALGGGLELALACDFIITGENAQFGLTESRIGMIPGWGGHLRLSDRIGVAKARELIYTGRIIDSAQAEQWGLINHRYSAEDLENELCQIVASICAGVSISIANSKKILEDLCNSHTSFTSAGYCEAQKSMELINHPDVQSALQNFLQCK